ncbi:MAG TPA: DUF481 domain-containing protein [Candidatus Hydrogenedentes bacterium]|nr:DUF481 domain-containing protein [Candidatus Hydrogenedentota bacterium]
MKTTCYIRILIAVMLANVSAALPVCADVVVLQNGESLSGAFSRVRESTLIFRTSLEGQMMTPMAEVRSISANATLYITMNDGKVYYGRLGVSDGAQHVFPLDGGPAVPIDATAIHETLPIPTPPAPDAEAMTRGWEISAGPGLQWRSDSAVPVEPTVRLDITGQGKDGRFEGAAIVERADPGDFPAYLRAQGEFFGRTDGATRPFAGVGFERDLDRALELRPHLALGLYQQLYTDKDSFLGGMAALGLEYERERERDEGREPVAGGRSDSDYNVQLRLGLRYYRLFAKRHSLSESLTLLPSLLQANEFRARSETAYIMPITDKLRLRLNLVIDYENNPFSSKINRWNATVGAGVNLDF